MGSNLSWLLFLIILLPAEVEESIEFHQTFSHLKWDLGEQVCTPEDPILDTSPHDFEDAPTGEWTDDMDPDILEW